MRNVSKFIEKIKTHILCSVTFFFENRDVYKIMSKNVQPERLQKAIWRRFVYWISKATRAQEHASARAPTHMRALAHTQKLFFPLQQWFRERTSV